MTVPTSMPDSSTGLSGPALSGHQNSTCLTIQWQHSENKPPPADGTSLSGCEVPATHPLFHPETQSLAGPWLSVGVSALLSWTLPGLGGAPRSALSQQSSVQQSSRCAHHSLIFRAKPSATVWPKEEANSSVGFADEKPLLVPPPQRLQW